MNNLSVFRTVLLLCVAFTTTTVCAEDAKRILIVDGPTYHKPGTHEVSAGCRVIQYCLENAKGIGKIEAEVVVGWPADKSKLENVATVVFSGDRFPLAELENTEKNMQEMADMVHQGCGIFCFHYATGLQGGQMRDDGYHPLLDWIGGYFSTRGAPHVSVAKVYKAAEIVPDPGGHPVLRGVTPFTLHEEPYINNYFGPNGMADNVTSLATSMLPPKNPKKECVAWAIARPDGGRGVGIVMPHFFKNWEVSELRTMLLNGVVWSAHIEVPKTGVVLELPDLESFHPVSVIPLPAHAKENSKP